MFRRTGAAWGRDEVSSRLALTDHLHREKVTLWLEALSIPDAPARREGLTRFLRFCATRMQGLPVINAFDFARATDFSKPVEEGHQLRVGDHIIASRQQNEPVYKLFFTVPGVSVQRSGVIPEGRSTKRFRIKQAATVLKSYTTGVIDNHSPIPHGAHVSVDPRGAPPLGMMAWGGNVQLMIPNSALVLDLA